MHRDAHLLSEIHSKFVITGVAAFLDRIIMLELFNFFHNLCLCCVCGNARMVLKSSGSLAEWLWSNAARIRNITPTVQEVNILFCTIWDSCVHRYSRRGWMLHLQVRTRFGFSIIRFPKRPKCFLGTYSNSHPSHHHNNHNKKTCCAS